MNDNLMIGDLLVRNKGLVVHFGLVVGAGVAHIWPGKPVTVTTLEAFADGKPYQVVKTNGVDQAELLVRLEDVISSGRVYSLLTNNCEHLASYLLTGVSRSPQLMIATVAALMGGLFAGSQSKSMLYGAVVGGFGGLALHNFLTWNARREPSGRS